MHPTPNTPHESATTFSLSLYFPLLSASKPRPYRHRLKRIRHGGGAVKKLIHVSAAPAAKSSKSRRRFRRTQMKRSWRGSWLRPVAVQVVEAHCPTRRGGGTAEQLQLGPASRAPTMPLVSVSSVVTAVVQDWFNPWLRQPEQACASACGWRTLKEDDEMWGSDEDDDEVNGELKDTKYLDGDA
ncbi:hypothetical protein VitviT2T_024270 [Vitis vinifera]|uniref:Uncharacterized protein n=1 Tax=Vitis vinifera TaxID=29760 RepID=A0ABY9DFG5_VITVI|nr:hypothetical protein VitviT2T_024270 [Vitis vinifera]